MFAQEEVRRWALEHDAAEIEAEDAGERGSREVFASACTVAVKLACLVQVQAPFVGTLSQTRPVAEHTELEEEVLAELDAECQAKSSLMCCLSYIGRSCCHAAPSMKSSAGSLRRLGMSF